MRSRQTKTNQILRKPLIGALSVFIIIGVFVACKKDEVEVATKSEQRQIDLLNSIYFNETEPLNDSLLTDYQLMKESCTSYLNDSSKLTRQELKELWKQTAVHFTKAHVFNITPVSRSLLFKNMYTKPLADNYDLEVLYKNKTEVSLASLPNNKKGLALLEKLLFKQDSLQLYSAVLLSCVDQLIVEQNKLKTLWEDDLKLSFIQGKKISINTGYGELINAFIAMMEVSKKEEFDQVFGYYSTQKYPASAFRSEYSKELFAAQYDYLHYVMKKYFYELFNKEGEGTLVCDLEADFASYHLAMSQLGSASFEQLQLNAPSTDLAQVQTSIKELIYDFRIEVINNYDLLLAISAADGD